MEIIIPDNATDTSLFCLPVQANETDGFKLAPCRICRALQGVDARIVNKLLHDEIIVEARDAIEAQVKVIVKECMERSFERIAPEVPFVVEARVAEVWG